MRRAVWYILWCRVIVYILQITLKRTLKILSIFIIFPDCLCKERSRKIWVKNYYKIKNQEFWFIIYNGKVRYIKKVPCVCSERLMSHTKLWKNGRVREEKRR